MIVVKGGGGTSLNTDAIVADIVTLRANGTELLLVHGGAQTTNQVAEALGHPAQFVTSETGHVSRRTDRRTRRELARSRLLAGAWLQHRRHDRARHLALGSAALTLPPPP